MFLLLLSHIHWCSCNTLIKHLTICWPWRYFLVSSLSARCYTCADKMSINHNLFTNQQTELILLIDHCHSRPQGADRLQNQTVITAWEQFHARQELCQTRWSISCSTFVVSSRGHSAASESADEQKSNTDLTVLLILILLILLHYLMSNKMDESNWYQILKRQFLHDLTVPGPVTLKGIGLWTLLFGSWDLEIW